MKILYCLDATYNSAGKERIVIGKANWLAQQGHNVAIFTSEQSGRPDFFSLKGVERIDSDILFSSIRTKNPIDKYITYNKKRKNYITDLQFFIDKFHPDIIISTQGYEAGIVHKIKGVNKKFIENHFMRWFRLNRNRKGIWKLVDHLMTIKDRRDVKKYDNLICLTREDSYNWNGIENKYVIPNFIEKKTEEPAKLENKSMLAVGRLEYEKGYDRLIAAWEKVCLKHPDWKLNIYGNGSLKPSLISQIENSGLKDKIKIHKPTSNIHQEYMNSSALIMTSRYEGLPMVMLEAMEAGLPVITFDFQCGPKDFIKDGLNGFLVNNGDIEGLSEKICILIDQMELRKEMGKNAFNQAKNYYPDIVMKKWLNLFESPAITK